MADEGRGVVNVLSSCFFALLLRFCLIVYGNWQDENMVVKYTDIDYHVFTDAARHVVEGKSPYLRSTYRYTPILAIILTPNIFLSIFFGKVLFVVFDVLTGYLLYKILLVRGSSNRNAVFCSWLWLFNPLPVTVSTRGSAESIMAFLVLITIYFAVTNRFSMAAFFFALSVHFKIFPIIYGLPLVLSIGVESCCSKTTSTDTRLKEDKQTNKEDLAYQLRRMFLFCLHPQRIKFAVISTITFLVTTGLLYERYGFEFLEHTYLYHLTRRDVKHNFSVYFYMMYLIEGSQWAPVLSLLAFLPQFVLTVVVGIVYYRDISFCCFVQTFAFVIFNKVCTSQYFLWYLCLLPLILPCIKMTVQRALLLTAGWFGGQGLWLTAAYYLEFEGMNTFLFVWMAGIIFFIINIIILNQLIHHYEVFQPSTKVE